jgi:hypothetical protein
MKRGQMKLSFGMIFSIILIVVFLVFAFYAITMILDFQSSANVGTFLNDLQKDVDNMWQNSGSQTKTYRLPNEIGEVCFNEDSLVSFYPLGIAIEFDDTEIKHIEILEDFCIENIDNKINIRIKKGIDESLVTIEENE